MCSNRVEHGINLADLSTVNPWATLDHPHIMGQAGESLEEHANARRFGATHREGNRNLEFRDSYKTSYGATENLSQHSKTESRRGHEYLSETGQEAGLSSYKAIKRISSTTQKEKSRNLEFRDSYKTSYGATENLSQHSQIESRRGHEYLSETGQEVGLSSFEPSKKISSTTQKEKSRNLEFRDSYKTSYGAAESSFQHSQTESRGGHEYLSETVQGAELSSFRPSKRISSTTQKEKSRNLEFRDSYKTSYGAAENSFQHSQTESRGGHEYLSETEQEARLSSYKASKKISRTTKKEKFRNSISSVACCRDYENRENSREHFSVNSWATSAHPHTARQDGIGRIKKEQMEEIRKCNEEEKDELRFNSKAKVKPARGHIVHSWDILFDMGRHGLEATLPQLPEGTCKSQTVSSLSFGSKGGGARSWM